MITVGIRLVMTLNEVYTGWIGDELLYTIITEAWTEVKEVLGELWRILE